MRLTEICDVLVLPVLSNLVYEAGKYATFTWCKTDISGISCLVGLQTWDYLYSYDVWIILDNDRALYFWKAANYCRHISLPATIPDCNDPLYDRLFQSESSQEKHEFYRSLGAYRIANVKTLKDVAEGFNPSSAYSVLLAALFSL